LFQLEIINITNDFVEDELIFIPNARHGMVDVLHPGQVYVVNHYIGMGTLPWSGITFSDEHGERHYFFKQHDHSDSPNVFLLGRFRASEATVHNTPSASHNPHPLAVALAGFNAHAEGETKAFTVHVDGSPGVVAIRFVDVFFAEATLFVFTGRDVISREIGSIEGFPFSINITAEGRPVKVTGDGGQWSYTVFGGATDLTTQTDVIIYAFTLYGATVDSDTHHYRFPGGWVEGWASGRYSITEAEFNAIRTQYGLIGMRSWRDMEDETAQILAMHF
jgi:hypothetical protein